MKTLLPLAFCLLLSFGAGFPAAATSPAVDENALTIGRVSQYPEEEKGRLQALATWLRANLEGGDTLDIRLVVVPDLSDMITLFKDGKVDMISETPFAAIRLEREAGAEIVLRERKYGVRRYYSLLLGNREMGLEGLEDLRGKVVAFEDPGSTSGFMLPLSHLVQNGIPVRRLEKFTDSVNDNEVGYFFAGNIKSTALLTKENKVAAFAVSDYDWLNSTEIPRDLRRKLVRLGQSQTVPRSLMLVRGSLPAKRKLEITALLAGMDNDPAGWTAMTEFNRVRKFDPLEAGLLAKIDALRALVEELAPTLRRDGIIP